MERLQKRDKLRGLLLNWRKTTFPTGSTKSLGAQKECWRRERVIWREERERRKMPVSSRGCGDMGKVNGNPF